MATLSEKDISQIKRQFLAIDEDGSGEISSEELRSILRDKTLRISGTSQNNYTQSMHSTLKGWHKKDTKFIFWQLQCMIPEEFALLQVCRSTSS